MESCVKHGEVGILYVYSKNVSHSSSISRSMTVAQILLFLPLTLSTLSTPAFLLLSLTLALHAMIHGTMVYFLASPALSVLQVGIHPVALLVCFNVFASSVNPWVLAATRWWGNILTFSGPFFIILEGLSSLIVAQKLGREGKKLIETEESEVYQFSLLVGSAIAYVTSAWWIVVVSAILLYCTPFSKKLSRHTQQQHLPRYLLHSLVSPLPLWYSLP